MSNSKNKLQNFRNLFSSLENLTQMNIKVQTFDIYQDIFIKGFTTAPSTWFPNQNTQYVCKISNTNCRKTTRSSFYFAPKRAETILKLLTLSQTSPGFYVSAVQVF